MNISLSFNAIWIPSILSAIVLIGCALWILSFRDADFGVFAWLAAVEHGILALFLIWIVYGIIYGFLK